MKKILTGGLNLHMLIVFSEQIYLFHLYNFMYGSVDLL